MKSLLPDIAGASIMIVKLRVISSIPFVNIDVRQLLHRLVCLALRFDHLLIVKQNPTAIILLDRGDIVTGVYRRSLVRDESLEPVSSGQCR